MSAADHADAADVARQIEYLYRIARPTPAPSRELERTGAALRALGRWMLATDSADPLLGRAAQTLESLVDELGAGEPPATRFIEATSEPREELLANARGTHPLLGTTHPIAPPIELRVEEGRVVGDVTFDIRFEGNVGWVHGGLIAAGFDIVAVQAARLSGRSGPTGTLTVRYLAPTPVGVPLRYEGWFERAAGRKLYSVGRLLRCDDESVTAEAEAIMVAIEG